MRYRKLSPDGDYVFGAGPSQMLVDSPEAVAQAARTRLALWSGEWFLDLLEGTPYETKVLGTNTEAIRDQTIQERILGTQGAVRITEYASTTDSERGLQIAAAIDTEYGATVLEQGL